MDDESNVVQLKPPAAKRRGNKKGRQPSGAIGPISSAKEITAHQREGRAIELRLRRYTLQQIADELGWETPSAAYKAIMRGLATEYPEAQRDQLRREEIATVDAIQRAAFTAAVVGEFVFDQDGEVIRDTAGEPLRYHPSDKAQQTVLKCVAMRAKLNGLEAPQQVQLSTREGEPVEINLGLSLKPEVVAAAELIRDVIMRQSLARAGDVIDAHASD